MHSSNGKSSHARRTGRSRRPVGQTQTVRPERDQAAGTDPDDPLSMLMSHLAELREYGECYLAARIAQVRLEARSSALYAALGLLGGVVLAGALVAAAVLMMNGTADAVGQLCDGRLWLGQILVGTGLLAITAGGVWHWLRRHIDAEHRKVTENYEHRKQAERSRFGTDVSQRAAARNGHSH